MVLVYGIGSGLAFLLSQLDYRLPQDITDCGLTGRTRQISFLKLFFMLFGAATLQNSIIVWASDHRKHHRYVDDKEKDPYAATKGFWYSHIGWMLRHKPEAEGCIENVKDLENDKIVAFQHRYYGPIAVLMCFGLPALIGASYGSVGGCLILVGLLRLVINHLFYFFY